MKIVFFSSHTATWYFAIAEATLANALQKKGHEVLFITPGNLFKGVSNRIHEKILRKEFSLSGYEIGDQLAAKDFKAINSITSKLTKDNFEKLKMDNISVGKIALYEFLLNHKKMSTKITDMEWEECRSEIKNSLLSFFACKAIIKKEKPDKLLMYNTLYAVNHVWEKYASNMKIPVYFLHHGLNLSDIDNTLIVAKNNSIQYFNKLKHEWQKFKKLPVGKNMASYVTDHFSELLKAKHSLIYSSPKSKNGIDIRKIFKINANQKILLATMSSYDEMFAAEFVGGRKKIEKLIFKNQDEWLNSLIKYVKNKTDLFLIIRVHPREFPNKREGVKSEHAKFLEKKLINLPSNIAVNWPEENLSIYDMAGTVDVILNAWSNVGVEMSLLGIPVVTYAKELILYPQDLNYTATSENDYFNKIQTAVREGRSYKRTKLTYKWLSFFYSAPIIRLRKKQNRLIPEIARNKNLLFSVTNFVFSRIPLKTRSYFVNKKRLISECRNAIAENIDILLVEKMMLKNKDTIVRKQGLYSAKVTNKTEDLVIKSEIRKVYKSLNYKF